MHLSQLNLHDYFTYYSQLINLSFNNFTPKSTPRSLPFTNSCQSKNTSYIWSHSHHSTLPIISTSSLKKNAVYWHSCVFILSFSSPGIRFVMYYFHCIFFNYMVVVCGKYTYFIFQVCLRSTIYYWLLCSFCSSTCYLYKNVCSCW